MNVFTKVFNFYVEGFRSMKLGRTLWLLILIKLFIMFAILKIFFFPRHLSQFDAGEQRNEYVLDQLTTPPVDTSDQLKQIK